LRLSAMVLDVAAALQERSFAAAAQYAVDTIVSAAGGSAGAIFYLAGGFHSYLYVPLITGGRKWGGLRLASRATRPFDPLVTTFCSAVGAMLSMKLKNPEIALAEQVRAEPLRLAVGAR